MPAFRLSLRTAVTAPFIAVFVVTAGLLAAWQQRQVDQLINRESLRLLDSLSTTTRHQLADYLETPLRVQQALAETVARQALYTPGDLRPIYGYLTRSFTELYAQHHQISLLSFGGVQGEYTGVRLEPDGHYRLILQDRSTQGTLQIFEGLQPGPPMSSLAGYDPRVRPWYQPAIREDGPHWSPIYTVTGDRGDATISAATAVRVSGQLAGVLAADVRLSSMNRFLRDEPLRGNGHIAVVDAQGYMVAHSSELSVLKRREGPYDPPVRLRLSESPDLALRSLAARLPEHLPGHAREGSTPARTGPDRVINLSFTEQGQIYHGQVTPFHDVRGIDWRILVLQPESDLVSSMREDSRQTLFLAFGLALLGLALGLLTGSLRWAETLLDSTIQMVRNIPALALIPLVILWFGIDESAKLFLISVSVFFPIYLNTFHGIRNVDPALIEMGRSYGLTRWQLYREVILPGALSSILVGLRFSLGLMWVILIVAETISAQSGIGYLTMNAREFLQTDVVLVGILLYALLGKLADWFARALEHWWLRWHPGYQPK